VLSAGGGSDLAASLVGLICSHEQRPERGKSQAGLGAAKPP
jgi:hypothetical protein